MYVCTTVFFPTQPLDRSWSHFLKHSWELSGLVLLPLHSSGSHDQNMGLELSPSVFEWLRQKTWFLSFTLFSFTDYGFELGQCIKKKQNWV